MNDRPSDVDPTVLELYKLTVEMADRVSSRRSTANAFFLTVQTALVTVAGVLTTNSGNTPSTPGASADAAALASAAAGIVLSGAWFVLLRSYRDLNTAKFAVITAIENEHLPIQPFTDEWASLKKDPIERWRPRYAELGFVERVVPSTFFAIYVTLAVITLLG